MSQHGVGIDRRGSLAIVTIDAGAGSNYLDEGMLTELATLMAALARDKAIEVICLCGRADSFLLGVDVPFFACSLNTGDAQRVLDFTRAARLLLDQIAQNRKRVVAWVRGPAFGAGLELALACHGIVASPTAKFCLPETGLGIYPGMGGTQRLPRRIGPGLAKWMIYTGAIVPAAHARAIGVVNAIHDTATTAEEALAALDAPLEPRPDHSRFAALEQLFATQSVEKLLDASRPMPSDPQSVRARVQMRGKAPIALRLAEQIIDRGMTMSLAEGLDEEFAHLAEVFATEDARRGLASLGKGRAKFAGR